MNHVGLVVSISGQKPIGLNLSGTTTAPPDASVARADATSPWTWNSGITHMETSPGPSSYELTTFAIDAVRLRWRSGTRLGRLVVPLV